MIIPVVGEAELRTILLRVRSLPGDGSRFVGTFVSCAVERTVLLLSFTEGTGEGVRLRGLRLPVVDGGIEVEGIPGGGTVVLRGTVVDSAAAVARTGSIRDTVVVVDIVSGLVVLDEEGSRVEEGVDDFTAVKAEVPVEEDDEEEDDGLIWCCCNHSSARWIVWELDNKDECEDDNV